MAVEISAKSSRLVAFCAGSLDREYLDPLIYRVGIDLFHVVILGLGQVDTRDTLLRRQDVNIVISSAAEVYYATAEALQEQIVVGDRNIRCLCALLCDPNRPEDASGEPHSVTHAPEALRYGVMSRCQPPRTNVVHEFRIPTRKRPSFFD